MKPPDTCHLSSGGATTQSHLSKKKNHRPATRHASIGHQLIQIIHSQIRHHFTIFAQPLKNIIPLSPSHEKALGHNSQANEEEREKEMAQAMASMTGLLDGTGSSGFVSSRRSSAGRAGLIVRAQQTPVESETVAQTGRRAAIGLIAAGLTGGAFAQAALADARSIKVGPPPPPSGGLPGTLNSDEARDVELPLKQRFFLQPVTPSEAVARVKESVKDIINLKSQIDKKAWPYVQNDLRLRASYLRYDLNTVISAKPKEEKKPLKDLTGQLLAAMSDLDHAAKIKSTPEAEKYYAATTSILNDVLAKLG